jgi:hypothetical protein
VTIANGSAVTVRRHEHKKYYDLKKIQAALLCPNCGNHLFLTVEGVAAGDGPSGRGVWDTDVPLQVRVTAAVVRLGAGLLADRTIGSVKNGLAAWGRATRTASTHNNRSGT